MNLIDKILTEWSYRVYDGMPNPKNPLHIIELKESMKHLKLDNKIIEMVVSELIETKDDDYVSIGYGRYKEKGKEKDSDAPTFEKDDKGNYVPIGKDKDSSKKPSSKEEPPSKPKIVQPQDNPFSKKDSDSKDSSNDGEIPSQVKNIFSGKQNSVRDSLLYMSDMDKQMFEDFKSDFAKLESNSSLELAQQMVEKYGLEASSGAKPKVYMRNINFEARKILGQNKATEFIKDTLEKSLGQELKGATKGVNVKQEVITTSKPGLSTKKTSKNDKGVQEFFNRPPYNRLDGNFHQMFGPTGEDGNLLMPSSQHSKEYLKQSITENDALDKTISKLQELEKTENVSPKIREALVKHKENLNSIYDNYDIPSKEASQAIGDSYAVMAESINVESPTLAGAMMKNMAEMALYDTELANGEEVYLPSHGSFPSGDKLRVTRDGNNKVERVASVSVKYGRAGKYGSFGFPGETGQYQKYHPDEEYRDRLNSRPGDEGYNLGVKDDIIRSNQEMNKIIDESGFDSAIKDKDKLISTLRQNLDELDKLKEEIGYIQNAAAARKEGKPPAWKQLNAVKSKIEEIEQRLAKEIESSIDVEGLNQLVGKDNAKVMLSRPACMITALTFAGTLKSSNGLPVIEHNHQEIKDGKYESHTDTSDDGTVDLKLWKLTWRAYDNRAGGLIASFNSDRREL